MNLRKEKDANRILRLLDSLPPCGDLPEEPPAPSYSPPIAVHEGACGKLKYESEAQCRTAIKRRLRKGANTSFLRPYPCQICHGWHMTSRANIKTR